jgi:hypothetical protein
LKLPRILSDIELKTSKNERDEEIESFKNSSGNANFSNSNGNLRK